MPPIYLDNHATTRCDPRVVQAMLPHFTETYGNAASRAHSFGIQAKAATERARAQVASLLGCSPKEVIFTSGATEANNLAILGAARARRAHGRHVLTTAIEHKAVLDPVEALRREGFDTTVVPVGPSGLVEVDAVAAALRPDTSLVSVMAANNEIGTLQPIRELAALCRERGVPLHTDAAQAVGKVPIDFAGWGLDLLSLSAHKLYGPKGIGALVVRRGRPPLRLEPIHFGGGHERGLRSGTLAVPLIVGLGEACALCEAELADGAPERLAALRDRLWEGLAAIGGARRHGDPHRRLPNNLNLSFEGVEAEALMMGLRDIAMSSGSACTSATLEPSHVLRAIGVDPEQAHGAIRLGLGRFTTAEEIEIAIRRFGEVVPMLRALDPMARVPARGA